jgi:hypothetical protein
MGIREAQEYTDPTDPDPDADSDTGTFTSFFQDKVIKKLQNSRNQGFSYYFCMMMHDPKADPYF